ncbi:MAG: Inosine-uridine preferring nucleoside hydrolase, partial [Cyanobacteriota bacterium]
MTAFKLSLLSFSIFLWPFYSFSAENLLISTDFSAGVSTVSHGKIELSDVDDAIAITNLLNQPSLNVLGISVQFGNTTAEKAYQACQIFLAVKAPTIPVAQGA